MGGLVLHEGKVILRGTGIGAEGSSFGRLVRFRGRFDPQFVLTDPSTYGQVILSNEPVLGAVGVRSGQDQSDAIRASGIICRELVDFPSYRIIFRNYQQLLAHNGKQAITSVHTEMLIGLSEREPPIALLVGPEKRLSRRSMEHLSEELASYHTNGLWAEGCSVPKTIEYKSNRINRRLLMIDLGVRRGIIRYLRKRFDIHLIPPFTDRSDLEEIESDGVFITNGPGNRPTEKLTAWMDSVLEINSGLPVYGCGMGALSVCQTIGIPLIEMDIQHRGILPGMLMGGALHLTYQNHSIIPEPSSSRMEDEVLNPFDGTLEAFSLHHSSGSRIWLSMYDPIPDLYNYGKREALHRFLDRVSGPHRGDED